MRSAGPSAFVAVILMYSVHVSATIPEAVAGIKCRLHPTNLCDNLSNAKECQATTHCIQTVWEKRSVPVDKNAVCQICKDIIKQARSELPSDNAEVKLNRIIEDSCQQIPLIKMRKECNTHMRNSMPELIEVLSSQMSHEPICTVVGLCNSVRIKEMLMQSYEGALDGSLDENDVDLAVHEASRASRNVDQPDQLTCTTCNLLMLAYKEEFESTTRGDMIENLLHTCYSLYSLSDTCANIVSNYFDDFYELAKQHLQSNDICQAVSICTNTETEPEAVAPPAIKSDQFYCGQCKQLVQHLRETLLQNTTEAQFKQKLEGYCKKTRGFKIECLTVVDQFYHVIYSFLKSQLDAEGVCSFINVCREHKKLQGETGSLNLVDSNDGLESSIEPQLPLCFVCKSAFRIAKSLVRSHVSNEKLKNAMNCGCNKLGKLSNKCHGVVDSYGDRIARFARNPRVLCSLLGMCFPIGPHDLELTPVESEVELLVDDTNKSEQLQLTADIEGKESVECHLCKKVLKTLHKMVRHHQDIKLAMDRVCHVLHKQNLTDECQTMIKQHADIIIDLMKKNVPRQQICRTVNMCLIYETENFFDIQAQLDDHYQLEPTSDVGFKGFEIEIDDAQDDQFALEDPLTTDVGLKGSIKCSICKRVIKAVQHIIRKGEDSGSIERALDKVCHKMGILSGRCEKVVHRDGNKIVDLITKKTAGRKICKLIHLCRKSVSVEDLEADDEEQEEYVEYFDINDALLKDQMGLFPLGEPLSAVELVSKGSPKCAVCKTAIKALQHMVHHHDDKGEITKALGHVCHRMGKLQHVCESVVNNHGAEIVDLMTKHMSAELICKAIRVCHLSTTKEEDYVIDEAVQEEQVNPAELEEPQPTTDVGLKGSPKCAVCKATIKALQHIIRKGEDSGSIARALEKVCHKMGKLGGRCEKMVQNHGSQIVDLITKKTAGRKICKLIGMCSKSVYVEDLETDDEEQEEYVENFDINDALLKEEIGPSPLEEPLSAVELVSKGSPKCAVCKAAIKALQHMVHHHEDKGEITKALGHVCHRMGKIQHVCESVVNSHGAEIVDLMTKHMSAELICKAIRVCHFSTTKEEDSAIAEPMLEEQKYQSEDLELVQLADGPVCIFCELFISKVKTSVNAKEKQAHFIKEILTSCHQLPSMFRKECHEIADRFGPLALDLLDSVSPQQVCRLVHFCFSQEEYNAFVGIAQDKLENSQLVQPEQGPFCIICELLVTRFERLLDTKAKRAHILHSILLTCDYLPHFIRDPCQSIIYGYGAAALDLISKVKANDVCSHMPLCSSQTAQDSNENYAQ
ncbi:uncharacterized protein LOC135428012 [Drosophila montana]|uniref:uncharacterized protein LOC135428012 n=1 Tax=Drosophila montana TaxID=40370 RepID=UPI00313B6DA6